MQGGDKKRILIQVAVDRNLMDATPTSSKVTQLRIARFCNAKMYRIANHQTGNVWNKFLGQIPP